MPTLGLADKAHLAARIVALRDMHPVLTSDLAFPLPRSTVVDFQCPETIVQWAYWGVMLCYPSRDEFVADVKDDGGYAAEVRQRLAGNRRYIANLNADLKKRKADLVSEDAVPDVHAVMQAVGPAGQHAGTAVEAIIADTAFLKSDSTNQRMDWRAKDLGFNGGFAEYQRFIRSVDDCASSRGYGRYRNLCVPSAYLSQLRKARPELASLFDSDEWKAGEAVYRQFSPYMIDGIVRSKLEPQQAKVSFIARSGFLYYIFGPGAEDWDGCLNTFEQGADPKTPAWQQAQKLARAMQADIRRFGPPQAD